MFMGYDRGCLKQRSGMWMVELLVEHMLGLADVRSVFQKILFPANLPHDKRSCVSVD